MKQILLKIALFFSLIMIPIVALFLTPYSKEFAYHYIENDCYNHGAWIFDRITKNKTPIDIAFIGSSHTIHAFQEKKMEDNARVELPFGQSGILPVWPKPAIHHS